MADPLSISASILTVLQVAATVTNFVRDLKDASHAVRKVQAEVENLQTVLSQILELCEKRGISGCGAERLTFSHGPLRECLLQLNKLRDKLEPVNSLDGSFRAVTWKFQQGEIKHILANIERQKTLLMVSLQIETQVLCHATKTLCLENQHSIRRLCDDFAGLKDRNNFEGGQSGSNRAQTTARNGSHFMEPQRKMAISNPHRPIESPEPCQVARAAAHTTIRSRPRSNGIGFRRDRKGKARSPPFFDWSSTPTQPKPNLTAAPVSYDASTSHGEAYTTVIHQGSNYGSANVLYGGNQVFAGGTVCFGGM